ncbi:ubiquitin-like-conjugating enzyme ATG10 [Pezoporus occidentalis]|uniref:ubiquitin-like-conjugating enzyme ATG10 n=1 Tax=Pezoporus occidentalis TaxID=407982 RepID=UPI002F90B823
MAALAAWKLGNNTRHDKFPATDSHKQSTRASQAEIKMPLSHSVLVRLHLEYCTQSGSLTYSLRLIQDLGDGYLSKTHFQIRNRSIPPDLKEKCSANIEQALFTHAEESLDDSQVAGVCATEEVVRYEYHVLYSSSYQVPVLYFRACFLDGRPLTLGEIWRSVHACYQDRLQEGPWDTITQQEHPLLGQPFFVLHPCRTNEFISSILISSRTYNRHTNYIILWLSTVGPVVGLNLPLSYAALAPEQNTNADSVERPLS